MAMIPGARLLSQAAQGAVEIGGSATELVVNSISAINDLVTVGKQHSAAYVESTKKNIAVEALREDTERAAQHIELQKEIFLRYKKAKEEMRAMGFVKIYDIEDGPITVKMMQEAMGE